MKCLSACMSVPPPPCKGVKCPETGRKAPKTGLKAPKFGQRPSLGVFGPHTDRDYAGCRPALINELVDIQTNVL